MNEKPFSEQIDDYKDTIFAIIGFINLFRYDDDTRRMRDDIKVFQGRRMRTSLSNRISPNNEVTPDFCIQDITNKGVVGEVKKSFPADSDLWMDDFEQLMGYDDDLLNWLTNSGKVDDHDIVLLPHLTRSKALRRYFEERKDKDITFTKSFVIVEFGRVQEAKLFFFFRKEYGSFKYFHRVDHRLEDGVSVPFEKLALAYEEIKLYDSKPPLPYLLHLVWESVIMRCASDNERFSELRKNSKLPIEITVDKIVSELYENYSFKKLNADNNSHQPRIPLKSWVKEAIDTLVVFELAKWKDEATEECIVYFKKFGATLEDFIDLCVEQGLGAEPKQPELFDFTS